MATLQIEVQGNNYIFDFLNKENIHRETPTVVILLKKTANAQVFESTGVYIFQKPVTEFKYQPQLKEVERSDLVLMLRYSNHENSQKDIMNLKAVGDILYSHFQSEKFIDLSNG